MTRVAWLDATAGVAGDMCLGALVDAGLPLGALEEVVGALGLAGVRVAARKVAKGPVVATKVDVVVEGDRGPTAHAHLPVGDAEHAHAHRSLADLIGAVRGARGLDAPAVADAVRAFEALAEAEGRVHGVPPDRVRFHEVGAADALVDVVGTCAGLRRLGVEEVRVSALPWPQGTLDCAHGVLPLPPPAVVHLCEGHPTFPSGEAFEQVTPTGAALVRALSRGHAPPAGFVPRTVGYGAGDHPGGKLPNVVRLVLGDVEVEATPTDVVLLETNLDDATGQEVARAVDRLLAAGALDAWAVPATMKKGRPGVVLSALAAPANAASLETVFFRETPTLGVRRRTVARTVLARRTATVATPWGPVRMKVRCAPQGEEATPEHDDCLAAAERAGVPWRTVAGAAMAAWEASARAPGC